MHILIHVHEGNKREKTTAEERVENSKARKRGKKTKKRKKERKERKIRKKERMKER